jgi:hypothetical protein
VKLPFVPGPSDVRAAVGGVRDGIGEALELVPRLARVLGTVEGLVDRVGALLDRVEGVVDRAEEAMTGLDRTRDRADEAISAVASTRQKADDAITAVGRTTERADGTLGRAEGLVGRMEPLIGAYEGPLTSMAPSLRRLAETLEPDEVEAMVHLIDQLPGLVAVMASLDNVGDDVHDLLDTMQDLRQVVKGFPGSRLLRRRGAEEIAEEDEDEQAADA